MKQKIVTLRPCPKCGASLVVNRQRGYVFCPAGHHYARRIRVSGLILTGTMTAQEHMKLKAKRNTASWRRTEAR